MSQYQLLPDLCSDEYDALKADIQARGVMVPVELDEAGDILDGHHRVRACAELGITEYPRIIRPGMSEDEKREHVLALNLDRRHLTREQRQELVGRLRADGWSLRRIADRLHVTAPTVQQDLAGVRNLTPEAEAPLTVTGTDGKHYPAKRPSVVVDTPKQQEQALNLLGTGAEAPKPMASVADLRADAKDKERHAKREAAAEIASTATLPELVTLYQGDFNEVLAELPDDSVDLIFTDPPYNDEIAPLYEHLAAHASRILKPGGSLITYVGQNILREAMNNMDGYLRYWWILCAHHQGGAARLPGKYVIVEWKPLLWYVRDRRRTDAEYLVDFIEFGREPGGLQTMHDWQQQEAPARFAIEKLTQPGDVVLDPFLGSGTTLAAAVKLGRRGIGVELDPQTLAVATSRLAECRSLEETA